MHWNVDRDFLLVFLLRRVELNEYGFRPTFSVRDTFFTLSPDQFRHVVAEMTVEDTEALSKEYQLENKMVEDCVKQVGWPLNEDLMALVVV